MSRAKIERWRRLAQILPRQGPGLTAETVRKRLESRTGSEYQQKMIKRDLEEMANDGDPPVVTSGAGAGTRYWIAPHFKGFDVPHLSITAALTLALTLRELADLLPDAAKRELERESDRARHVLTAHTHDPTSTWLESVRVVPRMHPLQEPRVDPYVIAQVKEALLAKKQVEIDYAPAPATGEGRRTRTHRLSILGLVRQHPVFTLVVYKLGKPPFVLNLDRIRSIRILTERANQPERFSLDEYLYAGYLHRPMSQPPQTLRLQVQATPAIAQVWIDAPLGRDQRIIEENRDTVTLSASVPDTYALRAYLRGFGADITVLAPPTLREAFAAEARRLVSRYRTGSAPTPAVDTAQSPSNRRRPREAGREQGTLSINRTE